MARAYVIPRALIRSFDLSKFVNLITSNATHQSNNLYEHQHINYPGCDASPGLTKSTLFP